MSKFKIGSNVYGKTIDKTEEIGFIPVVTLFRNGKQQFHLGRVINLWFRY